MTATMWRIKRRRGAAAGESARVRFTDLKRSWQRRVLRRGRWAFLLVGGVPVAIELGRVHRHTLDWLLGLAVGATMALWIALRDSPPAYIENWRTGYEAE